MSHTISGQPTSYTWDVVTGLPQVLQDGTNTYVYGLDLISATDGAGAQTYFTYDGLGSTTDLTDGSGTVTATYGYDVFGALRSGGGSNYWLFTGEQRDGDSGLYFLRARYYDPSTGRFLGKDPLPIGNRYSYVSNNPVNGIDPSGMCAPGINCPRGLDDEEPSKEGGMQPPPLPDSWYWRIYECLDGGCWGVACYDVPANPVTGVEQSFCHEVGYPDDNLFDSLSDALFGDDPTLTVAQFGACELLAHQGGVAESIDIYTFGWGEVVIAGGCFIVARFTPPTPP